MYGLYSVGVYVLLLLLLLYMYMLTVNVYCVQSYINVAVIKFCSGTIKLLNKNYIFCLLLYPCKLIWGGVSGQYIIIALDYCHKTLHGPKMGHGLEPRSYLLKEQGRRKTLNLVDLQILHGTCSLCQFSFYVKCPIALLKLNAHYTMNITG